MRIRIALTTAVAVLVSTAAISMLLGSTPAASARDAHQPVGASQVTHLTNLSLASFSAPAPIAVQTWQESYMDLRGTVYTPKPVSAPAPVVVPQTDENSVSTGDWQCIRIHESGDEYNNPAAPSGAYGILISTWHDFGYSGWPYQAAPAVQDALALRLHSMYGFDPWSSRFACGL